jgi:hypothetical protein
VVERFPRRFLPMHARAPPKYFAGNMAVVIVARHTFT